MVAEELHSSSTTTLGSGAPGRGKHRHAKRATKLLKDWLAAHVTHPYPNEHEKQKLSEATGMSIRQISYWFVNARRRQLASKDADPDTSKEEFGTPPSAALPIATQTDIFHPSWSDMSPLDRWRHSPPEEEPAPWDAITMSLGPGLAASLSEPDLYHLALPELNDYEDGSGLSMSSSSASSAYSCSSSMSLPVPERHNAFPRRQRRRKRTRQKGLQTSPNNDNKPFQCTFCTDRFRTRYDWTRHEGSIHLVLEKWTCVALGTTYLDTSDGELMRCSMCDAANPTDQHVQSHRSSECAAKPINQRSFYRRDHLRQHLRAHHNVNDILPSMKQWKSKLERLKSRCGFCGDTFTLWSERNDHIADHFRVGAQMKDWKGCRGLEPAVALLVQHAMPPYLIGTECNDVEPFSGSRAAGQAALPTQFEVLTAHLGDFVARNKAKGIMVTYDMLRLEARLFLYEDEDPLNQTPADNPTWMAMFAHGYGIEDFRVENVSANCNMNPAPMSPPMGPFPFTSSKMQQAAAYSCATVSMDLSSSVFDSHVGSDITVPWSWQTPECLAEFSQMCELQQSCERSLDLTVDESVPSQLAYPPILQTSEPLDPGVALETGENHGGEASQMCNPITALELDE